jgi:predicted Holliday junction resolvase-like endonuclease
MIIEKLIILLIVITIVLLLIKIIQDFKLMKKTEDKILDKIEELMTYAKENWEDQDTVNEAHFAIAVLKSLIK